MITLYIDVNIHRLRVLEGKDAQTKNSLQIHFSLQTLYRNYLSIQS